MSYGWKNKELRKFLDRINRIDRINFALPGWQGKKLSIAAQ
jgi:hypothetical protein